MSNKTNTKTFEQICPLWSKKLEKDGFVKAYDPSYVDGRPLDITDGTMCIVGEAWKFQPKTKYKDIPFIGIYADREDPEYYCDVCTGLASKFCDISYNIKHSANNRTNILLFKAAKEEFVKHWNEEHIYDK